MCNQMGECEAKKLSRRLKECVEEAAKAKVRNPELDEWVYASFLLLNTHTVKVKHASN